MKLRTTLKQGIEDGKDKVYAQHDAYVDMLDEVKEIQEDWKPWGVNQSFTTQQGHVDADFKTFCLMNCALSFAKSAQRGSLPQALTKAKLLNMLRCNFGTTSISLPDQCAADVAACLQWQRTHGNGHAYEHGVESFLNTLARASKNRIVASPFLQRADRYLLQNGTGNNLPKKRHSVGERDIGERDTRVHFIVYTVIGKLREDVCPRALLTMLLQLDLVVQPYNDAYPILSQNRTGSQGVADKYRLVTNQTTIEQAIRSLQIQRRQLFPKVFYTSWKTPQAHLGDR